MDVMSIVGARPQFVKLAPISWASQTKFNHFILHTGQHYDASLSEDFFTKLSIPAPNIVLKTGSGTHGDQTSRMLLEIEKSLLKNKPDHVIVYGDTNSTLAGVIAASKLNIPISHIEAGLRSGNRRMPEEINRIVADHTSNLLFAPTQSAYQNLWTEGLGQYSFQVGDVMLETLKYVLQMTSQNHSGKDEYFFATIHRVENTDSLERLNLLLTRLSQSPVKIRLYAHPRLTKMIKFHELVVPTGNLELFDPLSFDESILMMKNSLGVITDSGGIQKEAFLLEKTCLIARQETEWVETLESKSSILDPNLELLETEWWVRSADMKNPEVFGDGTTSLKIIEQILNYHSMNK